MWTCRISMVCVAFCRRDLNMQLNSNKTVLFCISLVASLPYTVNIEEKETSWKIWRIHTSISKVGYSCYSLFDCFFFWLFFSLALSLFCMFYNLRLFIQFNLNILFYPRFHVYKPIFRYSRIWEIILSFFLRARKQNRFLLKYLITLWFFENFFGSF